MKHTLGLLALSLTSALIAQDCNPVNLGTAYGGGDDVLVNAGAPIAIGFAFPFAGTTYTDMTVSTNGFFYLNNAGVPAPGFADGTATTAELASGAPRVCALWNDFNMLAANNSQVYVNSTASTCTVTWFNAQNYAGLNVLGPTFTVQARLSIAGTIEFFYGPGTTNNSTIATFAAGLVGASPGGGVTLPAASDLSIGGATVDNTVYEFLATANTFDLANSSLTLAPTAPGWVYANGGPNSNCARALSFGSGCGGSTVGGANYELFTTASPLDLSNTGHTYIWTGTGYLLLDGAGPIVAPVGAPTAFTDDQTQPIPLGFSMQTPSGPTSTIWLCSNGWLAFEATTSTDLSESVADLLLSPARLAFLWDDLNPATGGSITIDQAGTDCIVTFSNVPEFGAAANLNTVQIVLSSSGSIEVRYGACAVQDCLVGVSPGRNATDLGGLDYSNLGVTGPVSIGTGVAPFEPLRLTSGLPTLGGAWTLTTTNIEAISPVAVTAIGLAPVDPGIDLGFIGAPGCNLHITPLLLDIAVLSVNGAAVLNVPVPATVSTIGFTVTAQSACLTLNNAAQFLTSNGVVATVGY